MTDKNKNLARVRAIRGGNRGVITKLTNEAEELCAAQPLNEGRLETIAHLLETKLKLIKALDEEVVSTCGIEDIEREIEESDEIESRVLDIKRMIKEKTRPSGKQNDTVPSTGGIESQTNALATTTVNTTQMAPMQNDNDITSQHQDSDVTTPPLQDQVPGLTGMPFSASGDTLPVITVPQTRTKLPKLVLPKFRGEITKWQTFWDSFNSSVHSSPHLTQIDKFNHLNSLLEGQALRAIQGLTLTNANYQSAVEILHQRFGKPQQIISTHMDELLKIPACTSDKASQLRFVYDKISINVRGLEALGVNSSQYGSLLIPVIMAKLPQEVRMQVARNTAEDVWEISDIVDVIRKEVEAREMSEGVKINSASESSQKPKCPLRSTIPSAATLLAGAPPTKETHVQCVYCHEQHYSASCQKVSDTATRLEILKRDQRCFICLRSGHRSNQCVTKRSCRRCRGNHHQSICNHHFEPARPRESPHQAQATIQATQVQNTTHSAIAQAESAATSETSTITASAKSKGSVLLQTATAIATNQDGSKSTSIKILFDSGSQRSYVSENLKTRLGLKSTKTESLHLNTFGDGNYRKQKCEVLSLPLRDINNDEIAAITVLSSPVICSPLNTTVEVSKYPHLQGLQLADSSKSHKSIDVLIGSDYYWDFVTGDTARGEFGPTAINSKFGWLVSGPTAKCVTNDDITVSNLIISGNCSNMHEISQDPLVDILKQFWETETIGIQHSVPKELPSASPVPRNDIKRNGQIYEVGLPWKEDFMLSSDNYGMCASRLRSLHYKLRKEPELLSEYDRIIQEQQKAGIIEKVSRDMNGKESGNIKGVHYSPHHAVIRKDRETTKVRIVYDGSAKASKDSLSLNDCLEVGPNCIPHVFDMLAKFRCNSIGLTADIEKAFLMVGIKPEHRDMLRFLWFENPNSKTPDVVQYKFNRLVFGLRPSPSILGTTIAYHLNLYKQSEPEMAELLEKSLYVDDLIAGAEDKKKAFDIYQKAKKIMSEGGFNLRKWNSNSRSLLEKFAKIEEKQTNVTDVNTDLSEDDNSHANSAATNANIKLSEDDESYAKTTTGLGNSDAREANIVKVLGLNWNTLTDNFNFDFYDLHNYAISLPASKRSVLKVTAKVFDPLGFLTTLDTRGNSLAKSGRPKAGETSVRSEVSEASEGPNASSLWWRTPTVSLC